MNVKRDIIIHDPVQTWGNDSLGSAAKEFCRTQKTMTSIALCNKNKSSHRSPQLPATRQ